jgi:hypothetical protein
MRPEAQKELINAMFNMIRAEIAAKKLPENWGGGEIKQYLADKFAAHTGWLSKRDLKEYKNTVMVNNL